MFQLHESFLDYLIYTLLKFFNQWPSFMTTSLAALLSSYTNFFIVQFLCFILFNFAIFIVSSFILPNPFFKSAKNSHIILYSKLSSFKSFRMFSFQMSVQLPIHTTTSIRFAFLLSHLSFLFS